MKVLTMAMQYLEDLQAAPGALFLAGLALACWFSFRSETRNHSNNMLMSILYSIWITIRGIIYYIISGAIIMMTTVCAVAALHYSLLTTYFEDWGALVIILVNGLIYGYLLLTSILRPAVSTINEKKQKKK
jgi:hypothetical protein